MRTVHRRQAGRGAREAWGCRTRLLPAVLLAWALPAKGHAQEAELRAGSSPCTRLQTQKRAPRASETARRSVLLRDEPPPAGEVRLSRRARALAGAEGEVSLFSLPGARRCCPGRGGRDVYFHPAQHSGGRREGWGSVRLDARSVPSVLPWPAAGSPRLSQGPSAARRVAGSGDTGSALLSFPETCLNAPPELICPPALSAGGAPGGSACGIHGDKPGAGSTRKVGLAWLAAMGESRELGEEGRRSQPRLCRSFTEDRQVKRL